MKVFLFSVLLASQFLFASIYCVFDAQGNCIKQIEEQYSLENLKRDKGFRKYYIAFQSYKKKSERQLYSQMQFTRSKGKKRWYEVDWNQGVKLCPEENFNSGEGIWIVNESAYVDSANCVYVDGSPYTRSILVLFARDLSNLADADSSWILVNQTIVELAGKTFKIWDSYYGENSERNKIREVSFVQDLIVDKTELRVRDAIWLRRYISELKKIRNVPVYRTFWELSENEFYPSNDTLKVLDYPTPRDGRLTSIRSLQDHLNLTWKGVFQKDTVDFSKMKGTFVRPFVGDLKDFPDPLIHVLDTSANGYRIPSADEMYVLQRGGGTTLYAWGNEYDESEIRQYMNLNCSTGKTGIYPVKQYAPNRFGLYDVYGNAEEFVINYDGMKYMESSLCGNYGLPSLSPVCSSLKKNVCAKYGKTFPTKHYINGFEGMRMVRKLE